MTPIEIQTNIPEVRKELRFLFRDQIPFATSHALNLTGRGVVAAQRDRMEEEFTIRRPWVLRGFRILEPSTKRRLVTEVGVHSSRAFLDIHEEGGTKEPGGEHLAIPQEARRTKKGVVSRAERPRALKFKFQGKGEKGEVWRGEKRTWLLLRSGGTGAIFRRLGRGVRTRLRLLFTFTEEADIEPRLGAEATANTVIQETFAQNFDFAFRRAIRTSRG